MSAATAGPDFGGLFISGDQTDAYAAYRPKYEADCPQVYDSMLRGLPGHDLAIDVATGSGQAVGPLARAFKRVIGTGHAGTLACMVVHGCMLALATGGVGDVPYQLYVPGAGEALPSELSVCL